MSENLVIRSAGDIFGGEVILDTGCHACGNIVGGIGMRLGKNAYGCVLSWEDFEAAYLKLKAAREAPDFQDWTAKQAAEREAYLARERARTSGTSGTPGPGSNT